MDLEIATIKGQLLHYIYDVIIVASSLGK
jgi:hypothetical protein